MTLGAQTSSSVQEEDNGEDGGGEDGTVLNTPPPPQQSLSLKPHYPYLGYGYDSLIDFSSVHQCTFHVLLLITNIVPALLE